MYVEIEPGDYHVLHPRPVYLIVSRSRSGRLNVMAASWVSPVSDEPFLVAVPIWSRSLTHEYIVETGEFTINVLGEEHLNIAYKAGSVSGRDVDKLSALGLKPYPSKHIATPGLEGVLGFLECVVENRVSVGESTLFIAGVKAVHVRRDLYSRYGWNLTDLLPALKGVHWFGGTSFLIHPRAGPPAHYPHPQ